jgi:hypothetical protein
MVVCRLSHAQHNQVCFLNKKITDSMEYNWSRIRSCRSRCTIMINRISRIKIVLYNNMGGLIAAVLAPVNAYRGVRPLVPLQSILLVSTAYLTCIRRCRIDFQFTKHYWILMDGHSYLVSLMSLLSSTQSTYTLFSLL